MEKLDNKIDAIAEKLHDIDKTLIRNTASLEHHVKRTDLLEVEVKTRSEALALDLKSRSEALAEDLKARNLALVEDLKARNDALAEDLKARNDALALEVEPIKAHVTFINNALKIIGAVASVAVFFKAMGLF